MTNPPWPALVLALATISAPANAQTVPATATASANYVTITGRITDARTLPVVGAVITARGSAVGWTATLSNGSYVLRVPSGSYEILVRKGGYTPQTAVILAGPRFTRELSLVLTEANLASLNVGSSNSGVGTNSGSGVPFNNGVSALATLSESAIAERPELTLNNLATELAGVTLAHPADAVPDMSFVVRGGTVETRVDIDGHAVSAGASGRWNSSYASLPLFDGIEVAKGAGISGANAGESGFGTINLRTRNFSPGRQEDVTLGVDGYSGSYMTIALSGNLLPNDRLSYVFEHNNFGYNGSNVGQTGYNVAALGNGSALLEGRASLNSPQMLGSDLAKIRWRFNSNTSLTVGYLGIHDDYAETGGAFGTFVGNQTIAKSAPVYGQTFYSSPYYAGLVGQSVPAYTFSPNTTTQTNQPLFEAELRTAIKNDTLLIRPYAGTIFNLLDGTNRAGGPDPSNSAAWSQVTTGSGCSATSPCYTAAGYFNAYRHQEVDRLHGTTVTLIHPVGDSTFNLSYDYRSDQTTVASGAPTENFVSGAPDSLNTTSAFLTTVPTTLARNFDWSATYTVPLTSKLRVFVGDYYTDWKLAYGIIKEQYNFLTRVATRSTISADRTYQHDDPHLGFTWRQDRDTNFRVTAGSAITVPYAELVSGGTSINSYFARTSTYAYKNPHLAPESTIAYNLGVDHRLRDGSVIAADAFSNTIHNVFATQFSPFDGTAIGIPANSSLSHVLAQTTIPVNAPVERNFGLELSAARAPALGAGYHVAVTFQRAYLDQLPASFFTSPSSLVNGKQLDGATAVPYTQAFGELNYRLRSGVQAALDANYTGSNNWTNGPAFTVFSSMLRYNFKNGYRTQFSIENLFNESTGTLYSSGVANGGFAASTYGAPTPGGLPVYGASSTTRFAIAPRTIRFQVEAHVGH